MQEVIELCSELTLIVSGGMDHHHTKLPSLRVATANSGICYKVSDVTRSTTVLSNIISNTIELMLAALSLCHNATKTHGKIGAVAHHILAFGENRNQESRQ